MVSLFFKFGALTILLCGQDNFCMSVCFLNASCVGSSFLKFREFLAIVLFKIFSVLLALISSPFSMPMIHICSLCYVSYVSRVN